MWRGRESNNASFTQYLYGMIKIQSLKINNDKKERIVFNSTRDNKGKGIDAKVLIKILEKLDATKKYLK